MRFLLAETQFVLEHALGESTSAEPLLAAAETGKIRLVLPVFCLFEAETKLRRERPDREGEASRLDKFAQELGRKQGDRKRVEVLMGAAQELRQIQDDRERGLKQTTERLMNCAELEPLLAEDVAVASEFARKLSRGDPWVAAVIKRSFERLQGERLFLTKDKSFSEDLKRSVVGLEVCLASAGVLQRWSLTA